MVSGSLFRKGSSLMYLTMGVFVLLVGTFFVVNGNFNSNASAHKRTSFTGILRRDPGHKFPCNISVKADYVLQNKYDSSNCIPVVANPSQADKNVNHVVEVSGAASSAEYFATGFKQLPDSVVSPTPSGSPHSTFAPRATIFPTNSDIQGGQVIFHKPSPIPDSGTWSGPATRNPY